LIENVQDMRQPAGSLSGEAARARLEAYPAGAILPAPDIQESPPGVIDAILDRLQHRRRRWLPFSLRRRGATARYGLSTGGSCAGMPASRKNATHSRRSPRAGEVWPYWRWFYAPADRLAWITGTATAAHMS
jgi:hypothetical protein